MNFVIPAQACVGAIGVDSVGLPIFEGRKILSAQAHIMHGEEPMFLCVPGEHYRHYTFFRCGMLAGMKSTQWSCEDCVERVRPQHRRMRAIGRDGRVYLLCNVCGKYLRPDAFTPGQALRWRAGCALCHAWRWRAHLTRNAASFCGRCGGASRVPLCGWCVLGAPPVTAAAAFGCNVDARFAERNAAYMVFGAPITAERHLAVVPGLKK